MLRTVHACFVACPVNRGTRPREVQAQRRMIRLAPSKTAYSSCEATARRTQSPYSQKSTKKNIKPAPSGRVGKNHALLLLYTTIRQHSVQVSIVLVGYVHTWSVIVDDTNNHDTEQYTAKYVLCTRYYTVLYCQSVDSSSKALSIGSRALALTVQQGESGALRSTSSWK